MFSTFADVFASDDNESKNADGGANPFDPAPNDTDPFGISTGMKISASSQRFDDSPFNADATADGPNRSRSGRDALSSTNWNAYQQPTNEIQSKSAAAPVPTYDPFDDKTSSLFVSQNNITHSKSVNLINPFSIPSVSSDHSTAPVQASPIDLLFDLNVDPSTVPSLQTNSTLGHSDQVQSSYDLLGLNRSGLPTTTVKVLKSDSLSDLPKVSQTKNASLMTKNTPTAASCNALPVTTAAAAPPPSSASTLRVQATAMSIMTGSTSTSPFDDQFLDWMTQSDDLMCGVDPKLTGASRKIDINMIKSTEDLLGSIVRPSTPLATLRTYTRRLRSALIRLRFSPSRGNSSRICSITPGSHSRADYASAIQRGPTVDLHSRTDQRAQ